jgi:hypothetical protein
MSKTKKKSNRVKYNFELKFPQTFTLRDLRKATHHKVSYITLHSRVKKAMEDGTVVKNGVKAPDKVRRGRREFIYSLVNTPVVTEQVTAEVTTPSSTNW